MSSTRHHPFWTTTMTKQSRDGEALGVSLFLLPPRVKSFTAVGRAHASRDTHTHTCLLKLFSTQMLRVCLPLALHSIVCSVTQSVIA